MYLSSIDYQKPGTQLRIINSMKPLEQIQQLRAQQNKTLRQLADLTGLDPAVISNTLNGKRDSRIGTIEALASALNSSLVVVPNYRLPEVMRILSGKAIGPDDVPTAAEQILAGKT